MVAEGQLRSNRESQSQNMERDILNNVPNYDGTTDVERWVREVDGIVQIVGNLSRREKSVKMEGTKTEKSVKMEGTKPTIKRIEWDLIAAIYISRRLQGKEFVETLTIEQTNTWSSLRDRLVSRFKGQDMSIVYNKVVSMKQGTMSPGEYAREKAKLCAVCIEC